MANTLNIDTGHRIDAVSASFERALAASPHFQHARALLEGAGLIGQNSSHSFNPLNDLKSTVGSKFIS